MKIISTLTDAALATNAGVYAARRTKTSEEAQTSLVLDIPLLIVWMAIWIGYDLYSTWDALTPFLTQLASQPWVPVDMRAFAIIGLKLVGTFLPSIIQWQYARLFDLYPGAKYLLIGVVVFDVVTDYPAVARDAPLLYGPVIAAWVESIQVVVSTALNVAATIFCSFIVQGLVLVQVWRIVGSSKLIASGKP